MTSHLILDSESVASSNGVAFRLNEATKHPLNPVLSPGRPEDWDGLRVAWPGTVLYDARESRFKCWYSGLDAVQTPDRKWNLGYAESTDGVHWTKPELGQVDQDGRPTNRITEPDRMYLLQTVIEDDRAEDRDRRFIALWLEYLDLVNVVWRKRIAYSSDGITFDWSGPTVWEIHRGIHDIAQLLLDPDAPDPRFRIKAYAQAQYWLDDDGRPVRPSRNEHGHHFIRCISFLHGATFDAIEEPASALALAPEPGIDDELHFAGVQKVGQKYLMLFESDRFGRDPLHGDLRLAVSDDGQTFRRVHPTSAVVPTGPRGSWDENLIVTTTAGMTEVGDEIRIYYFGSPSVFRAWPPTYAVSGSLKGSLFYPTHIGLATLPLDRYAYAHGPGHVTTHPLTIGDEGLWLNADGSRITVTLDGTDHVGRLSDETYRTVYRRVAWEGENPSPGTYQVTIGLTPDARLFSVRA